MGSLVPEKFDYFWLKWCLPSSSWEQLGVPGSLKKTRSSKKSLFYADRIECQWCEGPARSPAKGQLTVPVSATQVLWLQPVHWAYGEPPSLLSWRTHCLCSRAQIKRGHTDAIWYCTTTWRLRRHTGQRSKTHMRQTIIGFTVVANISIYFASVF